VTGNGGTPAHRARAVERPVTAAAVVQAGHGERPGPADSVEKLGSAAVDGPNRIYERRRFPRHPGGSIVTAIAPEASDAAPRAIAVTSSLQAFEMGSFRLVAAIEFFNRISLKPL